MKTIRSAYILALPKYAKLGVLLFCALLSAPLFGQTPVTIVVTDPATHEAIPFASVQLTNDTDSYGAVTDMDGKATLQAKPGSYLLQVQHLSFESFNEPGFVVGNSPVNRQLGLKSAASQLQTVNVEAKRTNFDVNSPYATTSVRYIDANEISRSPGTFKDPSKYATTLAGVVSPNVLGSNEIIIRGNNSRGMGWYVEELPVPSPNHFSKEGASNGSVSMVSTQNLANAELYTGAFPAQYNNATAGVFALYLRDGNDQKSRYGFEISPVGIDLSAEGPFTKGKSSYLFNYRYSTLALFAQLGIDLKGLQNPFYHDLNYKLSFKLNDKTELSVFGVNGYGSYISERKAHVGGRSIVIGKNYDGYAMLLNGFAITHEISKTLTFKSVNAYNASFNLGRNENLADTLGHFEVNNRNKYIYHHMKTLNYINYHQGRLNLQTGMLVDVFRHNLTVETGLLNPGKTLDRVGSTGYKYEISHYISGRFNVNEHLVFTGGINGMYHYLSRKYVFEPRFGVKYYLGQHHTFGYAFGMHSRFENPTVYLANANINGITYRPNQFLEPMHAIHNVVSYTYRSDKATLINVELYHQYLYDVPVSANGENAFSILNQTESYIWTPLANNGKGWNYGAELTISQHFNKGFYVMANTSVFNANYTGSDGVRRNSVFNYMHSSTGLITKEFNFGKTNNQQFYIGLKGSFTGGIRYTPIDEAKSARRGHPVKDKTRINEAQGPLNYQVDMSLQYELRKLKYTMRLKFDVQNLTNRENTLWVDYDGNYGLVYIKQGQIIPLLFVGFDF